MEKVRETMLGDKEGGNEGGREDKDREESEEGRR